MDLPRVKTASTIVVTLSAFAIQIPWGFGAEAAQSATRSSQATLSQVALLNRCYAHLTRKRLPRRHPLRLSVLNSSMTAIEACTRIFEKAEFGADGRLKTGYDAESMSVLRAMNDFHRSWFPNDSVSNALPIGECFAPGAEIVHDVREMGLHVTRALFQPNATYKTVVTGDSALEAIRTQGASDAAALAVKSAKLPGFALLRYTVEEYIKEALPVSFPGVQRGDLVGVAPIDANPAKKNAQINFYKNAYVSANEMPVNKAPHSVNRSWGGGILGIPSYLLLNSGRPFLELSDGGTKLPRRWAKAVLSDLLCRDLPALRETDAIQFVQRAPAATTPAFRQAKQCMACHATMDTMASTARNVAMAGAPGYHCVGRNSSAHPVPVDSKNLPREVGMVDQDPLFAHRAPYGRLHFRSYDGTPINKEVLGIPGLGQALADTNDLYVCAAARYFQHFTGIQVSLDDSGDPSKPKLTDSQRRYRAEVIRLGLNLKKSQSLKQLLREIWESQIYQVSSMRHLGDLMGPGSGEQEADQE